MKPTGGSGALRSGSPIPLLEEKLGKWERRAIHGQTPRRLAEVQGTGAERKRIAWDGWRAVFAVEMTTARQRLGASVTAISGLLG
jgi:hypothetical protein